MQDQHTHTELGALTDYICIFQASSPDRKHFINSSPHNCASAHLTAGLIILFCSSFISFNVLFLLIKSTVGPYYYFISNFMLTFLF